MLRKPLYTFGDVKIYGNNHEIPVMYFFQLPEKYQTIAKKDYDWIDSSSTVTWEEAQFFIYKGSLYCLSDFMNIHNKFYMPNPPEWMLTFDGYHGDSYFSGILVKYVEEDNDYIKVYTYIS
jgi:hypothetical protein